MLNDRGKRTVHLMWTVRWHFKKVLAVLIMDLNVFDEMICHDFFFFQGVSPSCKAFDEYCIYCDSLRLSKCCGPYQNHTFITLDEKPHRITVAVIRNETRLSEASIEVPAMAEGERV